MYLMCIIQGDGKTTHDYTEVSEQEQQKIEGLIKNKKLPAEWDFKGKRIVSDTILGFSDKPAPSEVPEPKIRSMDELREWVHQQKWYRKR